VRDLIAGDQINQSGPNAIGKVVYPAPQPQPKPEPEPQRRTVLVLLSNPVDTPTLRLHEEHRAIRRAIRAATYRDQIDLQTGMAVRYDDVRDLLLVHKPAVVHYAGHSGVEGIALPDQYGRARAIHPTTLEGLFANLNGSIRCVVLNACLTAVQATAVNKHVPCVVGMSGSVVDPVAIEFADGFYSAISNGQSIKAAFGLGRNALQGAGMDDRDPELFAAPGVAERTFITG
jgi:CHAT domain